MNGPTKCSGVPIKQYTEPSSSAESEFGFAKLKCITEDHTTRFYAIQNFLFFSFKRQPKSIEEIMIKQLKE